MDFSPLILWFKRFGRNLPWREERTAWSVLVSEIMLQQTQAATVIPYYERWMKRFPSPGELAKAQPEEVLKMWEGLGYYRRARSLHALAKLLENSRPTTQEEWIQLPGIGPYTSAAIAAFAYGERTAPVDGNVLRVMARLFCLEIDIAKAASAKQIRQLLLEKLPQKEAPTCAEALIELGAMICKQQPQCEKCPLQASCLAYHRGKQLELPIKSKGPTSQTLYRSVAVIQSLKGRWLVAKKLSPGVFQGLWLFPYREDDDASDSDQHQLMASFEETFQLKLHSPKWMKSKKHTFTQYIAHLRPLLIQTLREKKIAANEHWHYAWVDSKELQSLTFCSGYREIRQEITSDIAAG